MSTRDHLIADWRARLADAEAEPATAAPPRAWLTRVKVRLYRFLISLYGTGDWRADEEQSPESQPVASAAVVFDSAEAETLTGKPAKELGKIRAVLKAVANNQDHRPDAGSLTGEEVANSSWLIVTSGRTNLSLPRCEGLLRHHGIECRKVSYGNDWALEVPATLHPKAWRLLEEHRAELRKPPRIAPAGPSSRTVQSQLVGMLLLLILPLVGALLFGLFANVGRGLPPSWDEWLVYGVALLITTLVSGFAIGWSWWFHRATVRRSNP